MVEYLFTNQVVVGWNLVAITSILKVELNVFTVNNCDVQIRDQRCLYEAMFTNLYTWSDVDQQL